MLSSLLSLHAPSLFSDSSASVLLLVAEPEVSGVTARENLSGTRHIHRYKWLSILHIFATKLALLIWLAKLFAHGGRDAQFIRLIVENDSFSTSLMRTNARKRALLILLVLRKQTWAKFKLERNFVS